LWFNGVALDNKDKKKLLGAHFDKVAKDIATHAAVHGVCYGFWNYGGLEAFTAKEYLPLVDERTGAHHAGIRFWQLKPQKPFVVQFFEADGWREYLRQPNGSALTLLKEKKPYKMVFRYDTLGEEAEGTNYNGYPIVPMYANAQKRSELTAPIKAKIDLYDAIMTAFGDTVLRTKALYWVFEGMSGSVDDLLRTKETIERLGLIAWNDETTAKAETVELPYRATLEYLGEIEKAIFRDAMVANPQEILGGNLTATAINASYHAEKLKVADMEWQAVFFIRQLLQIMGVQNEFVTFKHESVTNDLEISQRLALYTELPMEERKRLDPLFRS
jgi:hypothetical protein